MAEEHQDRLFGQVPRSLPPWMDGPKIRVEARRLGIPYEKARGVLRDKVRSAATIDRIIATHSQALQRLADK